MAELLLEFFSEEIPARMQTRAQGDLARLLDEKLKAAGLDFDEIKTFATPRRLTAVVNGLPKRSPDVRDERKGPRVGAPDKAVEGFLKAAGLGSLDEAEIRDLLYQLRIGEEGSPILAAQFKNLKGLRHSMK